MNKAFFFDRDGIVNERLINQYVKNINEFKFLNGFIDIFEIVNKNEFLPILITNQQGVGKGLMSENDLNVVHNFMQNQLFELTKSSFQDIYFCTDLKSSNSFRRKPEPGMLLEAIEKWDIDPKLSWILGDSLTDAIAGKRAKVNTILIGNYLKEEVPEADYIFINIYEALDFIKTLVD